MERTKKIVKSERDELIRKSELLKKEHDVIDGSKDLASLNKKMLIEKDMMSLEIEILYLGIEYAMAPGDEPEPVQETQEVQEAQEHHAQVSADRLFQGLQSIVSPYPAPAESFMLTNPTLWRSHLLRQIRNKNALLTAQVNERFQYQT